MKKITKKTRAEAALICDISASAENGMHWYFDIQKDLDASDDAVSLASNALIVAWTDEYFDPTARRWSRADDALAAQMLREGWSP